MLIFYLQRKRLNFFLFNKVQFTDGPYLAFKMKSLHSKSHNSEEWLSDVSHEFWRNYLYFNFTDILEDIAFFYLFSRIDKETFSNCKFYPTVDV